MENQKFSHRYQQQNRIDFPQNPQQLQQQQQLYLKNLQYHSMQNQNKINFNRQFQQLQQYPQQQQQYASMGNQSPIIQQRQQQQQNWRNFDQNLMESQNFQNRQQLQPQQHQQQNLQILQHSSIGNQNFIPRYHQYQQLQQNRMDVYQNPQQLQQQQQQNLQNFQYPSVENQNSINCNQQFQQQQEQFIKQCQQYSSMRNQSPIIQQHQQQQQNWRNFDQNLMESQNFQNYQQLQPQQHQQQNLQILQHSSIGNQNFIPRYHQYQQLQQNRMDVYQNPQQLQQQQQLNSQNLQYASMENQNQINFNQQCQQLQQQFPQQQQQYASMVNQSPIIPQHYQQQNIGNFDQSHQQTLIESQLSKNDKSITTHSESSNISDNFIPAKQNTDSKLDKNLINNLEGLGLHGEEDHFLIDGDGNTEFHRQLVMKMPEEDSLQTLENNIKGLSDEGRKNYINKRNKKGMTALHTSIELKQIKTIDFLLSHGADITSKTNDGHNPIHLIVWLANNDDEALLVLGVVFKHHEIKMEMKDLLDAFNANGEGALHIAARKNFLKVVKLLIEKGADKNLQELKEKKTALVIACKYRNYDLVKALVELVACVNIPTSGEWRPVHATLEDNDEKWLDFFMKNGVDVYGAHKFTKNEKILNKVAKYMKIRRLKTKDTKKPKGMRKIRMCGCGSQSGEVVLE